MNVMGGLPDVIELTRDFPGSPQVGNGRESLLLPLIGRMVVCGSAPNYDKQGVRKYSRLWLALSVEMINKLISATSLRSSNWTRLVLLD